MQLTAEVRRGWVTRPEKSPNPDKFQITFVEVVDMSRTTSEQAGSVGSTGKKLTKEEIRQAQIDATKHMWFGVTGYIPSKVE